MRGIKLKTFMMLFIFIGVDMALFFTFGVLFLDGMEFTSLKIISDKAPSAFFSWKDYLWNCTSFCILEDIIISAVFWFSFRDGKNPADKKESVYFWLIHINIKIFLNLHSMAMFLSTLEYSRESGWQELLLGDTDFRVPDNPFAEQRSSLLLCLSVILITFFILINYRNWKEKPVLYIFMVLLDLYMYPFWNRRGGVYLIARIVLGAAVLASPLVLRKFFATERKNKSGDRTDLYKKYVRTYSAVFILFTAAWCIFRLFISRTDTPNSILGVQYSAVLKFLTPVFLIVNILMKNIEKQDEKKYVQHSINLYAYDTLMMIFIGCAALVLLGEFGTIVCIMGLTLVMFLLFVDFINTEEKNIPAQLLKTLICGLGAGFAFVLAENSVLQCIMKWFGLELGGRIGNIGLDAPVLIIPGFIGIAVFICVFIDTAQALIIASNGISLSIFKRIKIYFFRMIEALKDYFAIGTEGDSYQETGTEKSRTSISVSMLIFIAGAVIIGYNVGFCGYSGNTVLKSFYMKAGNFSSEYEITENITSERAKEVRNAEMIQEQRESGNYTPPADSEIPENIKAQLDEESRRRRPDDRIKSYSRITDTVLSLDELGRFYNTEVYSSKTLKSSIMLKIMNLTDRLFYSSRMSELASVQKGLKQHMGFDVDEARQHTTYISSLQNKYFLTKDDVMNAPEDVRERYLSSDGTPKDGFYLLNQNGSPAGNGETEYIWYFGDSEEEYILTYDDNTESLYRIQNKELQMIFRNSEPQTAGSDYVLYTLSRMGVGNVLLLIFIPYFSIIILLLATNINISLENYDMNGCIHYALHNLGVLYAVSFMIQTMVIVCGVFGVSLFSGLSVPLIASGNFEILLNGICTAVILIAVSDFRVKR